MITKPTIKQQNKKIMKIRNKIRITQQINKELKNEHKII